MENGRWVTLKDGRRIKLKTTNEYMNDFMKKEKNKINTYSTDAYSGQVNMIKEIRNNNDEIIAKLQYTDYDNKAYIDLIETKEEYRRKGLATKLMNDLEKEYGENIEYGYSTPDGTKFLKSYFKNKKRS